MTETKIEKSADEQRMSMGVGGYGSFEITGTAEFVKESRLAFELLTGLLVAEYVRQEVEVKGRDFAEVEKEFIDNLSGACSDALKQSGDYKAVAVTVGDDAKPSIESASA